MRDTMIQIKDIVRQREFNYRRTPERRVQTPAAARAFVEEVGFCHFWPVKGVELPNLFHAIAGQARPVPFEHEDADLSLCWSWKDDSLDKKWWYYGKLLRRRATLVALSELPYFYALSENFGALDDYLQEYAEGRITAEAKAIYEALLEHGPLDTLSLRRKARMSAETAKSRFEKALTDLQVGLKVLPVGVTEAGAWHYAFVYELLLRWLPEIAEQARPIRQRDARRHLLLRYLQTVVAATAAEVTRLFGWTSEEVNEAACALEGAHLILGDVAIQGLQGAWLVIASALC